MAKKIVKTVENCKQCPYCNAEKFDRWIIMCKHKPTKSWNDYPEIPDWCPLEDETEE